MKKLAKAAKASNVNVDKVVKRMVKDAKAAENVKINEIIGSNQSISAKAAAWMERVDSQLFGGGIDKASTQLNNWGILPSKDEFGRKRIDVTPGNRAEINNALSEELKQYDADILHRQEYMNLLDAMDEDIEFNANDVNTAYKAAYNQEMSYSGNKADIQSLIGKEIQVLEAGKKSISDNQATLSEGYYGRNQSIPEKAMSYFTNEEHGIKRTAIAAGGVVGAGLVGRYATGGSLTRNGNGERDIALIPFV